MHTEAELSENFPREHAKHTAEAALLACPAEHSEQSANEPALGSERYVPDGQAKQDSCAIAPISSLYRPALHGAHIRLLLAPAMLPKEPAGQGRQACSVDCECRGL